MVSCGRSESFGRSLQEKFGTIATVHAIGYAWRTQLRDLILELAQQMVLGIPGILHFKNSPSET